MCYAVILLVSNKHHCFVKNKNIKHCYLKLNITLLQLISVSLEFYIWQIVCGRGGFKIGVKQRVHKCRFSQTRFTWNITKINIRSPCTSFRHLIGYNSNSPMHRMLNTKPFWADLCVNWSGMLSNPTCPFRLRVRIVDLLVSSTCNASSKLGYYTGRAILKKDNTYLRSV